MQHIHTAKNVTLLLYYAAAPAALQVNLWLSASSDYKKHNSSFNLKKFCLQSYVAKINNYYSSDSAVSNKPFLIWLLTIHLT